MVVVVLVVELFAAERLGVGYRSVEHESELGLDHRLSP
ncbi:hypothetical protein M1M38_gp086 [Halorubrum tailed virus 27]|uniref:Uncharacterized protein n=1 Tax=Halorubrum tailed virus 27 TaxID=2878008 RepID=A0AAE9BYD7_9CAUD|nr:hypothetical protein M1M38_gp086 [Halorubrum tailed virus 27]UBF22779.1 hypothetical protein HRTV-27_gp86 [Halorubrum tailed virus 27]